MSAPILRSQIEDALRRLDDTQAFERLVRELLSADGWTIEPRESAPGFRAQKAGVEHAGQCHHLAKAERDSVRKLKRAIGAMSRALRQEGVHPGRLLVVTSARIDPRALVPRRRRPGARPKEDVVVLDRDWIVEKLADPRNTRLLESWLEDARSVAD